MNNEHFSIESENAVLGCLILDNTLIDAVCSIINHDDFFNNLNAEIFKTILEMKKRNELPADILTITAKIKFEGMKESDVIILLAEKTQANFSAANAVYYAELVKAKAAKRKRLKIYHEAIRLEKNHEHEFESIDFVKKEISNIEKKSTCIYHPYSTILKKTMEMIDNEITRNTKLTGIASDFESLDKLTYGFQKGDLIILAARPSMGKSMLALNIVDNIGLKQKLPVVFFSLEMTAEQLCKRTISKVARINSQNIFSGNINQRDIDKLVMFTGFLSESKVFINDKPRLSIDEIRNYCRQIQNQFGLSFICIDYLTLIAGDGENETMRVTHISAELKALAKDFDVPVLCLSQLNRESDKRLDKRPVMSDLRQSGAIEQDADIILFLYRDNVYNSQTLKKNEAEIIIAKQRNGKTGTIMLDYDFDFCEFKDKE